MKMTVTHSEDDSAVAKRLAAWWCELNRYQWPSALGPLDDEWNIDEVTRRMNAIEIVIGRRACLREWNAEMSDVEFEEFWNEQSKDAGVK